MTRDQLKEGELYFARHSSGTIKVKLVKIETYNYSGRRALTRYQCLNIRTGREVTFKSPAKFQALAGQDVSSIQFAHRDSKPVCKCGQPAVRKVTSFPNEGDIITEFFCQSCWQSANLWQHANIDSPI